VEQHYNKPKTGLWNNNKTTGYQQYNTEITGHKQAHNSEGTVKMMLGE